MDKLREWKEARQGCRTNLYYLCKVLGYNDVQPKVHGRLIANLQQFKGGVDEIGSRELANLKENQIALPNMKAIREGYRPFVPDFLDLEGPRKRANFFPRGSLKTTVQSIAHSIQWIINYPDIRICFSTHTDTFGKEVTNEIRKHFMGNATFRYLFPEHVPWGKAVNDFGNQEFFDTLARQTFRREHTWSFMTVGSHMAGRHFDVAKHDDLVDAENVRTLDRIQAIRKHLGDFEPLIEKYNHPVKGEMKGWEDLAGTFYDFSDANYTLYEAETAKEPGKRIWSVVMESAAPNYPDGPYLWPERIGPKALKEIEDDPNRGPAVLAAQYLMNPIPPGSGLIESQDEIIWTPRRVMNELYARLALFAAVDLAGMDTSRSKNTDNDYSVVTVGGFGTDGHLYILECIHGRPSPEKVIEELFAVAKRHPRLTYIKVEKEAHARVLLKFLKSEESKRGVWLPIMELQRDNQMSKQQKIRGLQPWFKRGMIHFSDDLPCKTAIINEIMRFPKFQHDDILDTVCDLMSSRDGGADANVMVAQKEQSEPRGTMFPKGLEFLFNEEREAEVDPMTGWVQ